MNFSTFWLRIKEKQKKNLNYELLWKLIYLKVMFILIALTLPSFPSTFHFLSLFPPPFSLFFPPSYCFWLAFKLNPDYPERRVHIFLESVSIYLSLPRFFTSLIPLPPCSSLSHLLLSQKSSNDFCFDSKHFAKQQATEKWLQIKYEM